MAQIGRPLALILTVFLCLFAVAANAGADDRFRLAEQDIKAGLIYNFLKYAEWPGESTDNGTIVVCLFGRNALDGRLSPIAGRTVNQRVIVVNQLTSAAAAGACNMIFVTADEKTRWASLRAGVEGKPVLTVGDFDGFSQGGGMIEFAKVADRVSVRVNNGAIAAAGLVVHGRILQLAGGGK